MQNDIIERLFTSFTDLETAIHNAKATLEKKGSIPGEVIARLASYDDILSKQRALAGQLCVHLKSGNWEEVARHVTLINGLSAMIRDDARAILSSIALNSDSQKASSAQNSSPLVPTEKNEETDEETPILQ